MKVECIVSAPHSVALDGGKMAGPGTEVTIDPDESEHDAQLIAEGHLRPLEPVEADVEAEPQGGEQPPSTLDEVDGSGDSEAAA